MWRGLSKIEATAKDFERAFGTESVKKVMEFSDKECGRLIKTDGENIGEPPPLSQSESSIDDGR